MQNNIHAELAAMFPNKSGGIALYAHEAWRKYLTLMGPLATFGYWIGWSVVLSINGFVVGSLIQAEWFEDNTWTQTRCRLRPLPADRHRRGADHPVWAFNVFGVRPAVWFGYVTGALLIIPAAVLMFLPYLTGDWSSSTWTGTSAPAAVSRWPSSGSTSCAGRRTGSRSWRVRARIPRHRARHSESAARGGAFSGVVYALLPLGIGGTLGTQTIADGAATLTFYSTAFDTLVGSGLGDVMIFCIVAALVLSMNSATMDGSRALYGIARDGMTIKEFGVLNKYRVPARAMTLDAILNLFLITYFAGVLEILAVSNVGYVFATCTALSAFVLLRRDRPQWPRPIRLPDFWVPLAGVLFLINFAFLIFGGFIYSGGFLGITGYGYGWDKTRTGLLVLRRPAALRLAPRGAGQDRSSGARRSRDAGGGARPRRVEGGNHRRAGCLVGAQLPARQGLDGRAVALAMQRA